MHGIYSISSCIKNISVVFKLILNAEFYIKINLKIKLLSRMYNGPLFFRRY